MKLLISPLKTYKAINLYKKYKLYSYYLNKKKINKIQLKKYFKINYSLIVKKINIIKIKKKNKIIIKIIVKYLNNKKPIKLLNNNENNKQKEN
ncbi:hypothetical protein [Candidatus Shikimatogenerans bostrichidophilus]|uniref:hypothetical protein n=1 Tax=Candidatus Shikimatogenerans bostrichidophilus TaxID=2943807 RepID=UPI00296676CC